MTKTTILTVTAAFALGIAAGHLSETRQPPPQAAAPAVEPMTDAFMHNADKLLDRAAHDPTLTEAMHLNAAAAKAEFDVLAYRDQRIGTYEAMTFLHQEAERQQRIFDAMQKAKP